MIEKIKEIPKGWSVKKLGECFSFSAGGDVDKDCFSTINDKEHPYPIYANALNKEGLYGYSSTYKIKEECITITGRGDIGNVFYRKGLFTPIVRLITAIPFKEINAKFMSYLCSKIRFFNETTGVPQLTVPQVQGYKVVIPPFPEQEKIAEILECWDDGIEKLSRLIEQKKLLKKGLMQRLLSGKQRFSGFSELWKKVKLGLLGEFSKGSGITKNDLVQDGLPCVRYAELYTKFDFIIPFCISFISEETAKTAKPIQKGDILFAGSGETKEEIGKCAIYMNDLNAYAGGDNIIFRTTQAEPLYLSFYLNTLGRKLLNKLGQGDSIVHIHSGDLKNVIIPLPPLCEQEKIADILSKADEEIDLLTSKLSALKSQKKGLMQKLLTGQIRVKVA